MGISSCGKRDLPVHDGKFSPKREARLLGAIQNRTGTAGPCGDNDPGDLGPFLQLHQT
ncbi:conserved protein of unknown function [Candidatus Methylacidiphilum fumarolicum]|uniref:Uncharacterized protein n=1 Tax=Candidatus Methylacidiphilum fumarolicum TaxID=591154 RepID=A0ABM9ID83_9BACT|nr:conserved protein of unknown function [Candidatus Methylacidiphilum fumarolicum]